MSEAPERPAARVWTLLDRYGAAAVVVLVALPLRLAGLREWWLNPDEGIYYSILTRASWASFWGEVAANAHPPLYYLLLRALGFLTWDFLWLRAFSVVCGLAAVYAFWLAARELAGGGKRGVVAGLVAALLVAVAPGPVDLSRVMRPYVLQLALLAGALWLLLRYLGTDSRRALAGYVGLVCLALLTHYSSVLALGAFGLVVVHDGLERGWRRRAWVRLALAHAVPALLLATLYLVHLRALASSETADVALETWLSYYLVGSPREGWLAFMGFQNLLGAPWLRGPLALLLLAAPFVALAEGRRRVAVVALAGWVPAMAAAVLDLYPLGATRHSIWLAVFTVPVVAWLPAGVVSLGPRRGVAALAGLAALLAAGSPVGRWLGRTDAPWAPVERVLRWDDLSSMVDVLDPEGAPSVVLMSEQTFYLLLPLYPREREAATFAPDSSMFRFTLGARDVVVSTSWTLTAVPRPTPDGVEVLADAIVRADSVFPGVDLDAEPVVLLLVGGWRRGLVAELTELARREGFPLERRQVFGLAAFLLDTEVYLRAVGAVSGAR